MGGLGDIFVTFVNQPWLALAPAALFAALARFSGRPGLWLVALFWVAYGLYEAGMQARLLCSASDCVIRTDLSFIAPALLLASLIGVGAAIGPRHDGSRYRSSR